MQYYVEIHISYTCSHNIHTFYVNKWKYRYGLLHVNTYNTPKQQTGHVLQVCHNCPCITGVAQLAMYYRCGTTGHVLQVWHNWPCITGVAQLAMYYRCGTTGHVLHIWHNLPSIAYEYIILENKCDRKEFLPHGESNP